MPVNEGPDLGQRKRLRSKVGCMPCRRKKKKCDEQHPVCTRCARRRTPCRWPTEEEQMDKRFKKKRASLAASEASSSVSPEEQTKSGTLVVTDFELQVPSDRIFEVKNEDDLDIGSKMEPVALSNSDYQPYSDGEHLSFPVFKSYQNWMPGLSLQYFEAKALYHFLHDYSPLILPPYSDNRFKLHNTLIPLAPDNKALMDIFMACGAHYISFYDKSFVPLRGLFSQRYVKTLRELMANGQVMGNESWLFGAVQLMIGLDKLRGAPKSTIVKHIQFGANVIKAQLSSNNETTITYAAEQETISRRTLIESFVYHYVTGLLFCPSDLLPTLPEPDVVLEMIRVLKKPLFVLKTPWANNPLLGCAIDLFALAIKVQWTFRAQTPYTYAAAAGLLVQLNSWDLNIGTDSMHVHDVYAINFAYLVRSAMRLILLKMLNPGIEESDPEVQKDVLDTIYRSSNIENGDEHGCTGGVMFWPLAVTGLAAINQEQREYFKTRLESLAEYSRTTAKANSILALYEHAWDENRNYPGLDTLYERDLMDACCV